jgi:hypothetical protein
VTGAIPPNKAMQPTCAQAAPSDARDRTAVEPAPGHEGVPVGWIRALDHRTCARWTVSDSCQIAGSRESTPPSSSLASARSRRLSNRLSAVVGSFAPVRGSARAATVAPPSETLVENVPEILEEVADLPS